MCFHVLSLPLSQFIVCNGLELPLDINAVESGNIATDDLLLDLIGQIHSIFGFEVSRELESHEIVEEPVRIPDGEVGSPDNPVGPNPEEQVGHDFGKVAGIIV